MKAPRVRILPPRQKPLIISGFFFFRTHFGQIISESVSYTHLQELEDRWGVKRDDLEKSGDLTKMLHYGKSDLVKVKPTFGGESFELDARLSCLLYTSTCC